MPEPRSIGATYRLQLTPAFGFDDAAKIVPYLAGIGITHLYLSPILEAGLGSTHGYDVVDHATISTQLGGKAGFDRLAVVAKDNGLGIIVDIVPNHMSIADERNAWWWDVLENGPSARAASVFDVDWDSPEAKLKNVVLVPVLGEHRGRVLDRGEIAVKREGARFVVTYADHRYPVAPRAVGFLLSEAGRHVASPRLDFIADAYGELPLPTALDQASIERRHRDRAVLRELLDELLVEPAIAGAIDRAVETLNADANALDAFLDRQNYRLSYWRSAERDLDYRRFFDVNTLVGLRVEDARVFQATHAFLATLPLDGVRVDHIDGLSDPATYLARLREAMGSAAIFVEKILAPDEALPAWPVQGTTGYDFLDDLVALYADPSAQEPLEALVEELTGETRSFSAIATEARVQVLHESLDSDVRRLATLVARICEQHRDARDFTRHDIKQAIAALVASFPVYRTYVTSEVTPIDAAHIATALGRAPVLAPEVEPSLFTFLGEVLTLRRRGDLEAELVRRFQQLTPPAFAKGVEDTAFYRDARLVALDEVGNDPERFSMSIESFHGRNIDAMKRWPERMLATSTHDTKRSEDARARMVVIAELHEEFAALARRIIPRVGDARMTLPILHSLIGAWPVDQVRADVFAEKVAREAKRESSWSRSDDVYEHALKQRVHAMIADPALAAFVARIDAAARKVSIAWTLLKSTCPGFPDTYQGNERFRFDLVDPDNRRPIDWSDVVVDEKQRVLSTALRHRRENPHVFDRTSSYEPFGRGVIAFSRIAQNGDRTVVIAPRFFTRAPTFTVDLPSGRFMNLLDGGSVHGSIEVASVALLHQARSR